MPLKDTAEKTSASQTLTETICLADYCEYFPIYAYAEIYDSASDEDCETVIISLELSSY